MQDSPLMPPWEKRAEIWHELKTQIESFLSEVETLPVSPALDCEAVRMAVNDFSFQHPEEHCDVLRRLMAAMKLHQLHTPHPAYFGLFNPAPSFMGIVGDTITAALNPQMAAWSHSPFAAEAEARLVLEFAQRFGLPNASTGTFTSGGAEANQTAVLCALQHQWPDFAQTGLHAIRRRPVFYVSSEGHHSFMKAARSAGLGDASVRQVPPTPDLRMDLEALVRQIQADRFEGYQPFLIVGTAGTTGAGVIDPLPDLADIAQSENTWLHVDAAWGGAAALVPEFCHLLNGIEQADSITFDAHKFLSVPMGAGMFLTRHPALLSQTFGVRNSYMPKEGERLPVVDPYSHSLQWSRRFAGLKLFLTLATAGWDGYAETIRHQTAMGQLLRERLVQTGWRLLNETPLPVVCFTSRLDDWPLSLVQQVVDRLVSRSRVWVSSIVLNGSPAIRACITNFATGPQHVDLLIAELQGMRDAVARNQPASLSAAQ